MVVLAAVALADRLSTATFKVERSGVEKNFHFGEQIPSTPKERSPQSPAKPLQCLIDPKQAAVNCKRMGLNLLVLIAFIGHPQTSSDC
jgi:hypothetical protein